MNLRRYFHQGTIVAKSDGGFDNKQLGKLRKTNRGTYELIVGNHVMEGSSSSLKKPLVILEPTERVESFMGVDELRSSICQVRGVVRNKLTFKTRPNIQVGALGDETDDDQSSADRERTRC